MQRNTAGVLVSFLLFVGCSRAAADASSVSPAEPSSPAAGTAALKSPIQTQIADGARLYGMHCASCHGDAGQGGPAPMLVGEGALPRVAPETREHRTGEFGDVAAVFDFARATMPPGDPSVLGDNELWAILAFDLDANGIELSAPLMPDSAAEIRLQ